MSLFTRQQAERLSALLDKHGNNGEAMPIDEVQGFLLACISGPDETGRAFWLPQILGDDDFTAEEREEIAALLDACAAQMRRDMQQNESPRLTLFTDENGQADWGPVCAAYLYALDCLPTDWFATLNDENFEDLLFPVMAFSDVYEEGEVVLSEQDMAELRQALPEAFTHVFQYWQAIIRKPQTIRRAAKIGRNDPCPCNSGKKYKACCGRNA